VADTLNKIADVYKEQGLLHKSPATKLGLLHKALAAIMEAIDIKRSNQGA